MCLKSNLLLSHSVQLLTKGADDKAEEMMISRASNKLANEDNEENIHLSPKSSDICSYALTLTTARTCIQVESKR